MDLPIKIRPSFPHSQSLPLGNFHKPLILIQPRADRMKTTITENWSNWSHGPQPCLTQWNYEPCHVGPPMMDRSWWWGLTKRVPLEKGMANHSVFLLWELHEQYETRILNPQISDCYIMRTCLSSNQQIWQILRKSELLFWVTLIFYSNKISDKALKENLGNIQMVLLDCQNQMICHLN